MNALFHETSFRNLKFQNRPDKDGFLLSASYSHILGTDKFAGNFCTVSRLVHNVSLLVQDVPTIDAGWSSPVARQAHNLKVVGSNPTPATTFTEQAVFSSKEVCFLLLSE